MTHTGVEQQARSALDGTAEPRRHCSQSGSVTSHDPDEITPGGGVSPTGTPISRKNERLTAPRRASSAPASGVPRSSASDAARALAAPRRRSGRWRRVEHRRAADDLTATWIPEQHAVTNLKRQRRVEHQPHDAPSPG